MKKDIKNPNTEREKIYRLYADTLKKLKKNIRNARREKGFRSAEKFAEHLGVSLKTVQGWENLDNDRWPELPMVLNVCDKTGCDIDYLLGRMKEPTHDIKFIHEKTGLSVDAIRKLMSMKNTGFDTLISDILTDKDSDKLLSSIQMDIDEAEMWWNGLLENTATNDSLNGHRDIADFIASQSFIRVLNNQRTRFEEINGRLYERMIPVMLERDRIDMVIRLHRKGYTDDEAREYLKKNFSVTKTNEKITEEEQEEIIRIWHELKYDELVKMSYSEWMRKTKANHSQNENAEIR